MRLNSAAMAWWLALLWGLGGINQAAERAPASLFPDSTVVYAEIPDPPKLIESVLHHPIHERLASAEPYRELLQQKQFRQLRAVVSVIEAQLNQDWQRLLATLTQGGIAVGIDVRTKGAGLLTKGKDEASLASARDAVLQLIRNDARQKGNPDAIKTTEYRGVQAIEIGQANLATFGPWLFVTNKSELGRQVIDRYLDGESATLVELTSFQAAKESVAAGADVWSFGNVQAIREAGVAEELFRGQTKNPLAELIFGGLLNNLQRTSRVAAWVKLETDQLSLHVAAPHDPKWVGEARQYYFGSAGDGVAPPLARVERPLLSLSTYRDLAGMWVHAGDLFNEGVVDNLAQVDSTLTTLFSGHDFGEEILGAVRPEIQLVVARQDFRDQLPQPAIKLPCFAVVFQLRDAARMRDELRRAFQSLLGFINITGATSGQPQLDFQVQTQDGTQLVTSNYVVEEGEAESRQARINFNFSPSVAFVEDRLIVASSAKLAQELCRLPWDETASQDHSSGSGSPSNTLAELNVLEIRQALHDNRSQLVAQNMLEEGRSKQEAEAHIDTLLAVLGWFDDVWLSLTASENRLRLDLRVGIGGLDSGG